MSAIPPTVVALHRPAAVSGVSAAGARLARLPAPHTPWRPLVIGEAITPKVLAASPLADAPGLEVVSWDPGTPAVEQVLLVRDALRRLGATVVVPNDLPHGFAAAGLDHLRGVRAAAWCHADSHDGDELFLRCGELANAWRAVSDRADARLRALGVPLAGGGGIMPVCVEVPGAPAPMPAPPGGAAGAPLRLLYAGRLEKFHKRCLDLAALADELAMRGVAFELTIAGSGPAEAELRGRVAAHAAAGRVRLLGPVALARIPALLAACHVGVLVSGSEGMPTAVMETMAAGRPMAITTGCGGAVGVVRDGVEGLVVPVGAMDTLAAHLSVLASEPARLASMGAAAHAVARRLFTPAARGPSYDAFIAEAAARPARFGAGQGAGVRDAWSRVLAALEAIGPCGEGDLADLAAAWRAEIGAPMSLDLPRTLPGRDSPAERLLRAALGRLRTQGLCRVALYGAGAHTRKVARVVASSPEIVGVIDDAAEADGGPAGLVHGLPIVPPHALHRLRVQAIIVSSDEHEREMLPKARAWAGTRPVVGLYHAA